MDHGFFVELIVLLATSVFTVWLFKRFKLPAILAYLVAGVIAGPQVLSVITDPKDLVLVAELGIVFLLFSLGLEFSVPKLVAMRQLVFGVGSAQVIITLLIVMLMVVSLNQTWASAFVIGSIFALSSTRIQAESFLFHTLELCNRLNPSPLQMEWKVSQELLQSYFRQDLAPIS